MKFSSFWSLFLARALPVVSSAVHPPVSYDTDAALAIPMARDTDIEVFGVLEERLPKIKLPPIAFTVREVNYLLFSVSIGKTQTVNKFGDEDSVSLSISVTCLDCYLTGLLLVETTGVKTDTSLLGGLALFVRDPTEIIVNALDLNLEFSFPDLSGHFEFDITFAASGTYMAKLYSSKTPAGAELNDDNKVGAILEIELIFNAGAQIDFTMGFDITFPKGASFVFNPLSGQLVSIDIAGVQVKPLPVKFKSGSACISVIARIKLLVGVELKVLHFGFDFEAGVFFDAVVYKACVTWQPSLPCSVMLTQDFYEEIGAYARAVGDLKWADWSAGPTAIQTFLDGNLPSKCLESSKTKPPKSPTKASTTPTKNPPKKPSKTPTKAPAKTSSTKKPTKKPTKEATKEPSKTPTKSHKASSTTKTHKPSPFESSSTTKKHTPSPSKSKTKTHGPSSSSSSSSLPHHSSSTSSYISPPYGNHSVTRSEASSTTVTITDSSIEVPDTSVATTDSETDSPTRPSETEGTPTETSSQPSDTSTPSDSEPPSTDTEEAPTDSSPTPTITEPIPPGPPNPTDGSSTTITFFSSSTYTIISCASQLAFCPSSLKSPVTLTKTIIIYTTICPATQTDLPTAPPSENTSSNLASMTIPAITFTDTDFVELTPCATTTFSTVETVTNTTRPGIEIAVYGPTTPLTVSSFTYTPPPPPSSYASPTQFDFISTSSSTISTSSEVIISSEEISSSSEVISVTSEAPTSQPTSTSTGMAEIIISMGGFSSETPTSATSTTSSSKVVNGGQPTDIFQQGAGASMRANPLSWLSQKTLVLISASMTWFMLLVL